MHFYILNSLMDFKHVFENNRQAHIIDFWLLRSLQEQERDTL